MGITEEEYLKQLKIIEKATVACLFGKEAYAKVKSAKEKLNSEYRVTRVYTGASHTLTLIEEKASGEKVQLMYIPYYKEILNKDFSESISIIKTTEDGQKVDVKYSVLLFAALEGSWLEGEPTRN